MKNMKNDCELVANKNKINFKWNSKFPINTLYLMRGYLVVDDSLKEKFFNICFDAYWRDDIDISDQKNFDEILNSVKIDKRKFFKDIQDTKIKNKLKDLTNAAFEKDVFGAPTFVVNEKIFWGQDILDYLEDALNK